MKIIFNPAFSGNNEVIYHDTKYNIKEIFNEKNQLIRRIKYEKTGKGVDAKEFDEKGNIISHLQKNTTIILA